jgi:hypothetical protein
MTLARGPMPTSHRNQEPAERGLAHGRVATWRHPSDQGRAYRGMCPNLYEKWVFLLCFGILFGFMPIFN